jgi:hypothetical protein
VFKIAKKIISIVLVAFLIIGGVPKRADAVIPGIAAAAAALGCSEGTLVAVGGGLLAAGGIVAAGESEQVKVVAAAVAGLGSAALERLSAAVNAVGPGGVYTLPIDKYLAQDIADMVQNVNDVAESGEEVEFSIVGPDTSISPPVSQMLGIDYGYVVFGTTTAGKGGQTSKAELTILNSDGVMKASSKLTIGANVGTSHYVNRYRAEVFGGGGSTTGSIDLDTAPLVYDGGFVVANMEPHTIGISCDEEGNVTFYLDGVIMMSAIIPGATLGKIVYSQVSGVSLEGAYSFETFGSDVIVNGVDYTDAGLTPEQIAALAGTTITGDVVTNVYNPPAINPPVTWPEATDLTGVIGALQNVWNAVTQGFARVYTYLQAIVDSISTTLDPNILQEPINDLKTFITGKVPELPDLDTSGFSEREWSWMVTINHPINISFEVLNSETLENARPTIKGFTSGVLILLTTIYMYRRIPEIVKG